ncbi:hypothetical protein AGMMS49940_01160 [Spirochaetia bacterium]|nr:hypothetical protein AGMMS49940_01160 [Spirochaetia bacterium]
MFTHNFSVGKTRVFGRVASQRTPVGVLVFVLSLLMGALSLAGCKDDSDGFIDDGMLNSGLKGTWDSGAGDGYTITDSTMVYSSTWDSVTTGFTGSIEYIYNFSETAGVIIVQYTVYDLGFGAEVGQYQGVYFKDLTASTVKLGSAYASDYSVVEVATLAEAKEKFKPANISLYGGELSMASPQTRQ